MTEKSLSFVVGLVVVISLIVLSEVLAKADFPGGDEVTTDNNLNGPGSPKILSKRSKSVVDEIKRKKAKLFGNGLFNRSDASLQKSPPSSGEGGGKSRVSDMVYVGCYAPFEKQFTSFTLPMTPFNESFTRISCALQCLDVGLQFQVAVLKGAECNCARVDQLNATKVEEARCNVPCPVKDFKSRENENEEDGVCGGNRGFSVYCTPVPNGGECNSLLEVKQLRAYPPEVEIDSTSLQLPEGLGYSQLAMEEQCVACDFAKNALCQRPYHLPDFDYFPANSPEACVEYCATTVRYVRSMPIGERIRGPTTYALLTWAPNGRLQLPICQCINPDLYQKMFAVADDDRNCNLPCPGDSNSMCGGLKVGSLLFSTVYCVNTEGEDGHCRVATTTMETETPPSTTTEMTTTEVTTTEMTTTEMATTEHWTTEEERTETDFVESTTTERDDPCAYADCDDVTESTTADGWGNVTSPTTPTTTTTTETTTTTTPTTTSTTSTSTTTTTERTTSTTSTSTERTTTPISNCKMACQKTDLYGYLWEACANATVQTSCSRLVNNATGTAYWQCLENGEFATSQPDVSGCEAPWVNDCLMDLENIEEIDRASTFMDSLEEACRDAKRPGSDYKYFGRDITNITYMVDQVLFKVRNFPQSSMFTKFEQIIQHAVNINAFLIQYRDPWEFLPNSDKSSASNYIFETTESALFNLTEEFAGQHHSQSFSLAETNEDNLLNFLVFAETFSKTMGGAKGENYEFPPHQNRGLQDSFIKMPPDWKKLVTTDDVEIAAMSIDAEYVSYVMPGQYDELTSSPQLEGEDDCKSKLVNGKLISFSVASSNRRMEVKNHQPRMSFNGKGAEIVFYHDIEAWGKEKQDVPRRLHNKEKPRAVLGTTQCVFWDTNKLTWSTRGCRIVSSDRFQTVCECSHLTSFAVLMDVHRYVGKQFGLELVTLILCPISEVCLILSIVILSSVNNLQRIRTTITKNLSGCLFIGNGMVLFVLDRNYFNMSDGLCIGSAMLTHYVFLCAFMWMLIEGVQLYRMVVHIFDSGKSFMKHFAVFAYGSPLLIVTITATTGYLQGDRPYGGDVYCWLDGGYIWSFMAPVAIIIMINLVILFIALKTAYQLQQGKSKATPTFFNGKIKSYRNWFKGAFSLTCILGLTWVVGFFMLMRSSTGVVAAYLFTILNSSQGIFIFLFNCVFNEKVRLSTKRNLSVYLPSWLSSSTASTPGNDASIYGKRPTSPVKSTDASGIITDPSSRKRSSKELSSPVPARSFLNIPKARLSTANGDLQPTTLNHRGPFKVDFDDSPRTFYSDGNIINSVEKERSGSTGTVSSVESLPNSTGSDNGHNSSDTSQSALISALRSKIN